MTGFRVILAMSLALTGGAGAQEPATPKANQSAIDTPGEATNPHKHDAAANRNAVSAADFVQKAGIAGLTEVELSELALKQSKDPGIRQFAERMVKDHSKANMELASIALTKDLDAPKQLDPKHQKMLSDIGTRSGPAFDAVYAQHMAADHSKAVALFESAAALPDPDLSGFARKTLPTLQQHMQAAESLHSKIRTASDVQPPK